MTELYGIKDAIAQEAEVEMRRALVKAAAAAYPVYEELKSRLVQELLLGASKGYASMRTDEGKAEIKRLGTNLQFGFSAKDMGEEDFEQVLVNAAGAELSNRANQALHGTVTVASDYLYEKLEAKLRDALEEVNIEIQGERDDAEAAAAGGGESSSSSSADSKSPKRPGSGKVKKPAEKPKAKKPASANKGSASASASASGGKADGDDDDPTADKVVNLAKVETKESNLEHVTKTRAGPVAGRRPPTRKRRPAPPPQSTM
jgi:hypothetical protein